MRSKAWVYLLLLSLILMIWSGPSRAAPVDWEMAKAAACTQVQILADELAKGPPPTDPILDEPWSIAGSELLTDPKTGRELAFIFHLAPEGTIVISADTAIEPVIFTAPRGRFELEDSPENIPLHLVSWDLTLRLQALEDGVTPAELQSTNTRLWEEFLNPTPQLIEQSRRGTTWGPLIQTSLNWQPFCQIYLPDILANSLLPNGLEP